MLNSTMPVLPVTASNGGGFGGNNEFIWIFALLILFGGGFGGNGFGGNNAQAANNVLNDFELGKLSGTVATKDSIQMLTNSLGDSFAGVNANIVAQSQAITSGLSTVTFEVAKQIGDVLTAIQSCCCSMGRQMSEGFGAISRQTSEGFGALALQNANDKAEILAAIKDSSYKTDMLFLSQKNEAQAEKIRSLELAQATNGILKFPDIWAYNAGQFPPVFGGGCK